MLLCGVPSCKENLRIAQCVQQTLLAYLRLPHAAGTAVRLARHSLQLWESVVCTCCTHTYLSPLEMIMLLVVTSEFCSAVAFGIGYSDTSGVQASTATEPWSAARQHLLQCVLQQISGMLGCDAERGVHVLSVAYMQWQGLSAVSDTERERFGSLAFCAYSVTVDAAWTHQTVERMRSHTRWLLEERLASERVAWRATSVQSRATRNAACASQPPPPPPPPPPYKASVVQPQSVVESPLATPASCGGPGLCTLTRSLASLACAGNGRAVHKRGVPCKRRTVLRF